jgi:hypothetical protein
MRFYTRDEHGRRLLAWSGIGLAVFLYGGFSWNEYAQTGAVTVFWPAAVFWTAVVAWCVKVLLTPRDYTDIDLAGRVARVVRGGTTAREVPTSQLAPLEVFEFVPLKQSEVRVRYGVRSQPLPEVTFGDHGRLRDAERRLTALGQRLGIVTSPHVVPSPDLTADGEAKWMETDPKDSG